MSVPCLDNLYLSITPPPPSRALNYARSHTYKCKRMHFILYNVQHAWTRNVYVNVWLSGIG